MSTVKVNNISNVAGTNVATTDESNNLTVKTDLVVDNDATVDGTLTTNGLLTADDLTATGNVTLSANTSIGTISATELSYLNGVGNQLTSPIENLSDIYETKLWATNTQTWQALGNGNGVSQRGVAVTATGTATTITSLDTNKFTRTRRLGYATGTTTGALAGVRQNLLVEQPRKGMTMVATFGLSLRTATDKRGFVGFSDVTQGLTNTAQTGALLNRFGFSFDATETNWYWLQNGSSGNTVRTNLGVNFPVNTINTDLYQTYIKVVPINVTDYSVFYKLHNLTTGLFAEATVLSTDGDLPGIGIFMGWNCNIITSAAASHQIHISHVYVESGRAY